MELVSMRNQGRRCFLGMTIEALVADFVVISTFAARRSLFQILLISATICTAIAEDLVILRWREP